MPFVIELGWLMSIHRDHCFAAASQRSFAQGRERRLDWPKL
jgi:hypothetical protein